MLYLAVLSGALLGGFVQSITGFGAAVVMMTVLPYFFSMTVAPSISSSICLGLTLTLTLRFRKYIKLRVMLLPTLLYTFASLTVIRLLGRMDLHLLTISFGILLMLLGSYLLLVGKRVPRPGLPLTVACSLLAGVCGGLFSIGGPIMAVYFLAATESREEYIGNIQSHFAVNNLVNLSARAYSGYYSLAHLPLTVLGIAGVVLGERFGIRLGKRLNAEQLRCAVYAYIILSGAITVVQQLI